MSRAAACAFVALLLAACSRPAPLSGPDEGRTVAVGEEEVPFDLEAGLAGEEQLEVAIGVPLSSLSFVLKGDSATGEYRSALALSIRLVEDDGRATVRSSYRTDTVLVRGLPSTKRDSSVLHVDTFSVAGGRYTVVAEVGTQNGRSRSERRLAVDVPGPGEEAVSVPKLERCAGDRCRREVGHYVHAPFDSLRLSARLSGPVAPPLQVYRLLRDTTVARPPYWVGPPQGSLAARGVSLDTATAVRVRSGATARTTAYVRRSVGPLGAGIYRAVVEEGGVGAARTFGVVSAGFPHPSTLDEAIDALGYIAYSEELVAMRAAPRGPARRAAFDAFWARTAGDRATAARSLQRYYARVAEANRRFTASKLGWKTDRGMIYVVFGPPAYVERTLAGEVWHYGASGRPSETFVFGRALGYGTTGGAFEPYLLERNAAYEQGWRRAVQVWRSGSTG